MADKPDNFPDWAMEDEVDPVSGQNNVAEPPAIRADTGWTRREIPPRQWFNWWMRTVAQWVRFLDEHAGENDAHNATSAATAGRLILRDANGRASIASPILAAEIANKGYVDDSIPDVTFVTADTTLTAEQLGMVVVDASSGDIDIELPPATAARRVVFVRVDDTSALVTLQKANGSSDTLGPEGWADAPLDGKGAVEDLWADGVDNWALASVSPRRSVYGTPGPITWRRPLGRTHATVVLVGGGAGGEGGDNASNVAARGGGGGACTKGQIALPGREREFTGLVGAGGSGSATSDLGEDGEATTLWRWLAGGGKGGGAGGMIGTSKGYDQDPNDPKIADADLSGGYGAGGGGQGGFQGGGVAPYPIYPARQSPCAAWRTVGLDLDAPPGGDPFDGGAPGGRGGNYTGDNTAGGPFAPGEDGGNGAWPGGGGGGGGEGGGGASAGPGGDGAHGSIAILAV